MKDLESKYAVAFDEDCEKLRKCDFSEKETIENVCLYYAV